MSLITLQIGPAGAGPLKESGGSGGDISLIIKEKITSGSIIRANLIDVSAGAESSLTGLFDIGGKLLTAAIPEDLYNEFALGKSFNGIFTLPVKLRLENILNGGGETGNIEIVFKVLNETPDNLNIQKALDFYNKVFAGNIENNVGAALRSVFAADLNGMPAAAQQNAGIIQDLAQSITASVKGNFLFIHVNFGSALGSGSVILTSAYNNYYVDDAPYKKKGMNAPKKKYMFMLETELNPLGHIKLFSYYEDKSLTVKVQECSPAAKELINKNLNVFKEMLSADGITVKEMSFKSSVGNVLNGGAGNFGSGGEAFSDGKIINERV